MNKEFIIKKGKGIFLYDINSNRFYDLQKNSNILGHSYKKLTTIVKNNISSKWNICGNTLYHKRIRSLFKNLFSSDYYLANAFSLIEFILRLYNYSVNNSYDLILYGERFKLWFKEKYNFIKFEKKNFSKNIIIYDMAEIFIESKGNVKKFNELVKKLKKGDLTIYNYFWYPYLDIITNNATLVILPEIYSGNFNYLNILINKKIINEHNQLCDELNNIPSLYISSSLKMFYDIKKIGIDKIINLKWNNFIQAGRMFTYNNLEDYKKVIDRYLDKKIILSNDSPYYNYLPINMEEYQIKYLSEIKL